MSCRGELESRLLARGAVTRRSQVDGHAVASVEIHQMMLEGCAVPSFSTKLVSRTGAGEIFGNFRSRNSPPGRSQKGRSKMPLVLGLSTNMNKQGVHRWYLANCAIISFISGAPPDCCADGWTGGAAA